MNQLNEVAVDQDVKHLSPQDLIDAYLPMVKAIASHVIIKCPVTVELDDLINVGVIGLMDAAERFSPSYGKPFRFYAELRVRGEILDELRNNDWIPRSSRKRFTAIERKRIELEKQHGPGVTDTEMADALGMKLDKFQRVAGRAQAGNFLSLDDVGLAEDEEKDMLELMRGEPLDPDATLRLREVEDHITAAIQELPHREKVIISLYYFQELSLKEIGCVLGVTESRISQMHSKALQRLRRTMLRARMEQG